jgi:hypothetical protein
LTRYSATHVGVLADYDHGEGWVVFQWPHDLYGYDELKIDFDGHCSRRMPNHSGQGPPGYAELTRDGIRLRFNPQLARKLELTEQIEVSFCLSDDRFSELRRWVEFFEGSED